MSITPEPQLSPLHLFEAVGIELEYMIVRADTLDVFPVCDRLLSHFAGEVTGDVHRGAIAWSNELALHVVELKTHGPTRSLSRAASEFQASLTELQAGLAPLGARLLPTGMHPWMDPHRELQLWPHENDVIYNTFHRIFDCTGHGWANLQSMHINLPFHGDQEFARLHAAIRCVLPLLPGLAASSPYADGRATGKADTRLHHYRHNAARVPSVSGHVVPEPVYTTADYQALLERIYADLAPHDPDGVLAEEWVNARGAIARFDRGAIEIRVLDTQECPAADLAIAALVVAATRHLTQQADEGSPLYAWDERRLSALFDLTVADADEAVIDDLDYLAIWGLHAPQRVRDVWVHLAETLLTPDERAAHGPWFAHYGRKGSLAQRLTRRLGAAPGRAALEATYRDLADCLETGQLFP